MKTTLFILSLIMSSGLQAQSAAEEHARIAKCLNYYLEGGTNNDFNTLKKAFHKNATMKSMGDQGIREVNALEFFGNAMKPGPKSDRKTRIVSIDVAGTAASARLEIEFKELILTDYMHLLKIDGEWKIVSKIFSGRNH